MADPARPSVGGRRRRRLAVATAAELVGLDDSWPLLRAALVAAGVDPQVVVWDDPAVDWRRFDVVLASCMWGYVDDRDGFVGWAGAVGAATVLVNPAAVLTWNSDKTYLADLAGAGVATVPTRWVPPGAAWDPPSGDFVVKPAVGSGARDAARYRRTADPGRADAPGGDPGGVGDAAVAHVARLHRSGRTAMVQPYVPSVDAVGETSLIYLGGGFSHAVARGPVLTPDAGVRDRLWERQRVSPVAARTDQLDVAGAVLDVVGDRFGPTAYARIDLVDDGSGPLVLEAELVEPALFLDGAPGSAEHLAAVLASLAG